MRRANVLIVLLCFFSVFLIAGCAKLPPAPLNNLKFLTVGNESGNITIDNEGYLQMHGNARTVDDLRFPVTDLTVSGVSDPTKAVFSGTTYGLSFSGSALNQVWLTMQLPHTRDTSTNLSHHFHFSPAVATTNNTYVEWCLEYTCASLYNIFPVTATKCVNTTIDTTTAYKHYMSPPLITDGTNLGLSAMCNERIYRNGAVDNNTQAMFLLEYDVHYIINSAGNKVEAYEFGI